MVLTKAATLSDIKKAYKTLALIIHPDKNNSPDSTEAFKVLSNAFETLSDPIKKNKYDRNPTKPNFKQSNSSDKEVSHYYFI